MLGKRRVQSQVGLFTLGCFLAAGCSGQSSTSGPASDAKGPTLSVPSTTEAGALSSTDESSLCDWVVGTVDVDAGCRYQAVQLASAEAKASEKTTSELRADCAAEEQRCSQTKRNDLQQQCATWFDAECHASVEQIKDCFSSLPPKYAQVFTAAGSCETFDPAHLPAGPDVAELLSGCSVAIETCPKPFAPKPVTDTPTNTGTTPAAIRACESACSHFTSSCSADCPTDCTIQRLVYGEACDGPAQRFYDCAQNAQLDCAQTDLTLAPKGCAAERSDYLTCYALGGVLCEPGSALDQLCEKDPAHPHAKRCVSDAVPADCTPGSGAYYCCATP